MVVSPALSVAGVNAAYKTQVAMRRSQVDLNYLFGTITNCDSRIANCVKNNMYQPLNDQSTTIEELRKKLREFREVRGWTTEDPKDMALSLILEAAELLEYFQWKTGKEVEEEARLHGAICDELADIVWWVFAIAERLHIDVSQAFDRKMIKNAKKYPVHIFNPQMDPAVRQREYYKIKARTRGGHPLAENDDNN